VVNVIAEDECPNAAVKVRVAAPFRIAHAGVAYSPGDTADVPDDVARRWLASGWVTEVKPAKKQQPKG
jgi:hypothetical protein